MLAVHGLLGLLAPEHEVAVAEACELFVWSCHQVKRTSLDLTDGVNVDLEGQLSVLGWRATLGKQNYRHEINVYKILFYCSERLGFRRRRERREKWLVL